MIRFLRIYHDDNPAGGGGGQTPPGNEPPGVGQPAPGGQPATPPPLNIPKTKEDWDRLARENPSRWIELTQPRMDQAIREGREAAQRLEAEQAKARNLAAELERYRSGEPPTTPPLAPGQPQPFDPKKPFSRENMPQTKEQWDEVWLNEPTLASELSHHKFQLEQDARQRHANFIQEFQKQRRSDAEVLWGRHPELFVQEINSDGSPKTDANGKPVFKIDPNTSGPMLNLESEKGKLWVQVYNEDPQGYDQSKYGTRNAMNEMERRLRDSGQQKVAAGQPNQPANSSQDQAAPPDQRGMMPSGVTPPVQGKVSFGSEEERVRAEKAVQRGTYKSLEEYCRLRDQPAQTRAESGRVPSFGKK